MMIKRKLLAWLIQSVITFIVLSLNWGVHFTTLLLSLAGVVLLPFSVLSDYVTKRLSNAYRAAVAALIHIGVSIGLFLAGQGWILVVLYGGGLWLADEAIRWKITKGKIETAVCIVHTAVVLV